MKQDYSEKMRALSKALGGMHRALMDAELSDTRISAAPGRNRYNEMQRLLHDPALAWLKPISDFMVELDHLLSKEPVIEESDAFAVRRKAEALFGPSGSAKQHAVQSGMANLTDEHPPVTMALGDLRRVLGTLPGEG